MPRFFAKLSYNGRNYVGWQIQPNGISVQQVVQNALSVILRESVVIVGAGRTDAGVHARRMVAHFDWDGDAFSTDTLVAKLNSFLPKDISVSDIRPVKPDAHARFSALTRTYSYHVITQKDPFLHQLTYRLHFLPDIQRMNMLCRVLKEYSDFTSFSKLHTDVKTNLCKIESAQWEKTGDHQYVFTITADRFLRNMVRAIVGTLLEAGRGRVDERGFRRIIEAKNRSVAGDSVPGHALFLEEVMYPDDIWL
ncbi:tRNA pseudouridine(38-40) synthase TruA [Proteiniphilum sp. UBA1028]|jgi:tRNA pseudouridine38-40 synthase|uniref:tRNA pseudouridine(38-40) synthase TruA n=1 Tax=Proteiniphilum sp. UBA1028 TaxID=1947251 RepID=UPI000E922495|nr:tRNA pseudouridine(38-40) synthase TruA [Proteiniphilum sp. UBA1028]HBG57029.1 tRNA pseudouridine(38-40) synthase TruA [Porphyromonadaceae bacterium]